MQFLRGSTATLLTRSSVSSGQPGSSRRRSLWFSIVVISASAIGVGYAYTRGGAEHTFITAPVERGAIATIVKATGSVEAVITVEVSSRGFPAEISEVLVNFSQVKAGQPIARVDPEGLFTARVNEAKAVLKVAKGDRIGSASFRRTRAHGTAECRLGAKDGGGPGDGLQMKLEHAEKEFKRHRLARGGNVAERDLTQAQALRDVPNFALRSRQNMGRRR